MTKLKMNHIKSICILAGIMVASGFIIWTIMLLKEDTGKYDDNQQPSIIEEKKIMEEIKNTQDDIKDVNDAINISERESLAGNQGRPQEKQPGEAHFEQEVSENRIIDIPEQSTMKEQKLTLNAEPDRSMQYDTHKHIDVKDDNYGVVPERGKIVSITESDNTISITIKNKNPVIQQRISPDQPVYMPIAGTDINLQHPTSTSP